MEKNFLSSSSSQAYLGVHIRITHKQSINAYIQKLDDVSATKELIQMIIKSPIFNMCLQQKWNRLKIVQ